MKEVFIDGSLDYIIKKLHDYKENGEHVFCMYEGVKLCSDDFSDEAAHIATVEVLNDGLEKLSIEEQKEVANRLVKANRAKNGVHEVNKEIVIEGVKFICEHQDEPVLEIMLGLFDIGCNFNDREVINYRNNWKNNKIYSYEEMDLVTYGAEVIRILLEGEFTWDQFKKHFLDNDSENSMYDLIRYLNKDESYTRDHVLNNDKYKKML